ncbi:MAG: ATP-binding protein, partial [Bacteroidota bacterium]
LKKRIKIVNELSKSNEVATDRDTLSIILRNLISNAIKFTNINGRIVVTEKIESDHHRIGVLDNGIGIPEEIKQKIFDSDASSTRFGTSQEKGRGVGLLIVKDLVFQLGGQLWIEDNPGGQGTAFYFTLLEGNEATQDTTP